jgi:hypothetical protein
MSVVIEKGAIRSQIRGVENIPVIMTMYEVIDDRKHSKSNKVYIDIDLHNQSCTIGYSEEATKENIDRMVTWFNTNKEQSSVNNIASKGIGLKYFEFRALGRWKHISKNEKNKKCYTSEINTFEIWNAEINDEISSTQFSEILHRETSFVKEEDEEDIPKTLDKIFTNYDDKYPFKAKTIFTCKKMMNLNLLHEYKDENNNYIFDDIIKRLQIKYYNEIFNGLELYIKLPGYTEFKQIKNENIDIIGFTNNKQNELKIDIIINPDVYYGYIFKIDNNTYKFGKNGNSIIRQKIENSLSEPDFSLFQYNTSLMNKEEKTNSIVGKSEESYAGLFIEIGGTFINDQPVEWQICKRNLSGNKNYRAILQCQSTKSKYHLKLDGLKAQFNLATMSNLHNCIKCLTDVYKNYCNKHMPILPDEYVQMKPTATKSISDKKIEGYFYIIELGQHFFKLGYSNKQTRIFDYLSEIPDLKLEFPDIIFHDDPHCRYLSIKKINNITVLEQKIKTMLNESVLCQTYDNKNGTDIREYFQSDTFDKLLNEIKTQITIHNNN